MTGGVGRRCWEVLGGGWGCGAEVLEDGGWVMLGEEVRLWRCGCYPNPRRHRGRHTTNRPSLSPLYPLPFPPLPPRIMPPKYPTASPPPPLQTFFSPPFPLPSVLSPLSPLHPPWSHLLICATVSRLSMLPMGEAGAAGRGGVGRGWRWR